MLPQRRTRGCIHSDNFERTPRQATVLDQAMIALLADLQTKGLLGQTLVVQCTEFGRWVMMGPLRNSRLQTDCRYRT